MACIPPPVLSATGAGMLFDRTDRNGEQQELDAFVDAMIAVREEAQRDADFVKHAPNDAGATLGRR